MNHERDKLLVWLKWNFKSNILQWYFYPTCIFNKFHTFFNKEWYRLLSCNQILERHPKVITFPISTCWWIEILSFLLLLLRKHIQVKTIKIIILQNNISIKQCKYTFCIKRNFKNPHSTKLIKMGLIINSARSSSLNNGKRKSVQKKMAE